ncbi:MAG: hypothetical protein ACYTJ0_00550 [Planctomycetota bacterium]
MSAKHDIPKAELLQELGYGGELGPVDRLLQDAGLSSPRKIAIHHGKRDEVQALIERTFLLVCQRGDCKAAAERRAGGQTIAPASDPSFCAICGGSVIRRSVEEMIAACRAVGWSRLVVVGGSPNTHRQLNDAIGDGLEVRLVDGTVSRTRTQAKADLSWADHVVLWGTTMLDHKVSNLYSGCANCSSVQKRSVAELAAHVTRVAKR